MHLRFPRRLPGDGVLSTNIPTFGDDAVVSSESEDQPYAVDIRGNHVVLSLDTVVSKKLVGHFLSDLLRLNKGIRLLYDPQLHLVELFYLSGLHSSAGSRFLIQIGQWFAHPRFFISTICFSTLSFSGATT